MRVLITGADGQVGQALLTDAPNSTRILATARGDLDIARVGAVNEFVARTKPDLIINTAAYTAVDNAETEPELARQVNEMGARHLAAAAAAHGARMIQLSTDFVFDGASSAPYTPGDEPAPLSVYGATKRQGERAVLAELPTAAIVLRTAWIYASRGRNFLLTMLRLMHGQGSVRVVADQIGTPTSAISLAEAIWALGANPDVCGIHHWTDSGVASWYDFAVAIAEEATASGLLAKAAEVTPIMTEDYPTTARRPRFSILDTRSTVRATGIVPRHWRANLRRVMGEIELV